MLRRQLGFFCIVRVVFYRLCDRGNFSARVGEELKRAHLDNNEPIRFGASPGIVLAATPSAIPPARYILQIPDEVTAIFADLVPNIDVYSPRSYSTCLCVPACGALGATDDPRCNRLCHLAGQCVIQLLERHTTFEYSVLKHIHSFGQGRLPLPRQKR